MLIKVTLLCFYMLVIDSSINLGSIIGPNISDEGHFSKKTNVFYSPSVMLAPIVYIKYSCHYV